jgi:hypothetical protein
MHYSHMKLKDLLRQERKALSKSDIDMIKQLKLSGLSVEEIAGRYHEDVWVIKAVLRLEN